MKKNNIHIIPAAAIDASKWNEKISIERNGLIYSTTNYLNALTDNWCGLVVNDYQAMVAIPFRKKGFINYCYTPSFIQQLGIIGTVNEATTNEIISAIKKKFRYGSLQFNFLNRPVSFLEPFHQKINYLLPLNRPFQEIAKGFRKDLKMNLEKCRYHHFNYIKSIDCKIAIELYKSHYDHKIENTRLTDYQKLIRYCNEIDQKNESCFTRTIVNEDHEIVAIALILKDEKRLYNIANTVTIEGRVLFANHLLLSKIMEEFADKELLFDFEGSMIPGVQEFYTGFGPIEEVYFTHHYNNLPFPLSLIH